LDKNLAWKLSRVVGAEDAEDAIQFVPGDAAFDIFIRAVKDAGGATELRRRAEGAIRNFQAAVIRHLGDRPTLDLVVDGLQDEGRERLGVARKLLFRGSSGVLGVQAKALMHTMILAPSQLNAEMLDAVRIGGWIDFRRIRSDARWVLFRRKLRSHPVDLHLEEPIDPACGPDGPRILREFCSPSMPEIHTRIEESTYVDELGRSSVGNSGLFNCISGHIIRTLGSRFATPDDPTATLHSYVSAPVENLQIDLIVHRDCEFIMEHRFDMYTMFTSGGSTNLKERDILPIRAEKTGVTDMEGTEMEGVVRSPHFPSYGKVLERAFARMNWSPQEFLAVRYSVPYPPFPSTAVISFSLEQRKDSRQSAQA
jgi:hypothetical protein